MRSLHAELAAVPDFRRAQGKRHSVACVLTVHVLAELASLKGCLAAAQFARALSRDGLEAVGAWLNPKTGLREPVPESTIHRVIQSVDPEALEDVTGRWSRPRIQPGRALAADAGASAAPTATEKAITRPWPLPGTTPGRPSRS